MPIPTFLLSEIKDTYIQQNFKRLSDFFKKNKQFVDFKHFEIVFTSAQTNYRLQHGLGFVPLDIIKTKFTGTGNLTFNYDKFTTEEIDITTTGECAIRFFAGTFNG